MPKRSRRRIANPLLSGSSPDRCSMPGWRNEYALVLETSSFGSESASLSSGTKFRSTEGAGEWSPSRLESGGLVKSQWGSIPPPSAKYAGVLLGEQPASKTGAQCSNHCTGARSSERRRSPLRAVQKQRARRTESHRTANAARVKKWRHWVRLPGPLPSLRAHGDCVVRGSMISMIFGCKADTVGSACL